MFCLNATYCFVLWPKLCFLPPTIHLQESMKMSYSGSATFKAKMPHKALKSKCRPKIQPWEWKKRTMQVFELSISVYKHIFSPTGQSGTSRQWLFSTLDALPSTEINAAFIFRQVCSKDTTLKTPWCRKWGQPAAFIALLADWVPFYLCCFFHTQRFLQTALPWPCGGK